MSQYQLALVTPHECSPVQQWTARCDKVVLSAVLTKVKTEECAVPVTMCFAKATSAEVQLL